MCQEILNQQRKKPHLICLYLIFTWHEPHKSENILGQPHICNKYVCRVSVENISPIISCNSASFINFKVWRWKNYKNSLAYVVCLLIFISTQTMKMKWKYKDKERWDSFSKFLSLIQVIPLFLILIQSIARRFEFHFLFQLILNPEI